MGEETNVGGPTFYSVFFVLILWPHISPAGIHESDRRQLCVVLLLAAAAITAVVSHSDSVSAAAAE